MNLNSVQSRVFLCVDATSRAIWIRTTSTHEEGVNRIEDAGLEVVEEQTEDYIGTPVSQWTGTILLRELKDTDAMLFE
jgi:hypothetical protein